MVNGLPVEPDQKSLAAEGPITSHEQHFCTLFIGEKEVLPCWDGRYANHDLCCYACSAIHQTKKHRESCKHSRCSANDLFGRCGHCQSKPGVLDEPRWLYVVCHVRWWGLEVVYFVVQVELPSIFLLMSQKVDESRVMPEHGAEMVIAMADGQKFCASTATFRQYWQRFRRRYGESWIQGPGRWLAKVLHNLRKWQSFPTSNWHSSLRTSTILCL